MNIYKYLQIYTMVAKNIVSSRSPGVQVLLTLWRTPSVGLWSWTQLAADSRLFWEPLSGFAWEFLSFCRKWRTWGPTRPWWQNTAQRWRRWREPGPTGTHPTLMTWWRSGPACRERSRVSFRSPLQNQKQIFRYEAPCGGKESQGHNNVNDNYR